MTSVEQLYKDYEVLAEAKDKAGEHEDIYRSIMSGIKGGASEKRLACQFMARFFKYFPHLAEVAISNMLDLCEDDDAAIRKQAIKELPSYCKVNATFLPKIADILVQLLQSDEATELTIVHLALVNLLKTDPKGTLSGVFNQILQGEDIVRERAIKFLALKLKDVPEEQLTKEIEEIIVTQSKTVLDDVTGEEFVLFMKILSSLVCMQTVQGRQQLVEIITKQAELDTDFVASDPDCMDKLIQCSRQLVPFLSKNVHSDSFVSYIADQVLPVLSDVASPEAPEGAESQDSHLDILKLFAEMSMYIGDLENIEDKVSKVYDRLLEYMPLPPLEDNKEDQTEEPKLQFSYVECLLFAFHQFARKYPEFLTAETNADRLKDFRIRLQYFARGVQVYIKQLRMALQGKTGDDLKTDENKIKVVALKITTNINVLVKDLMHNPPSYKSPVTLSWKPIAKLGAATTSPGTKRSSITPITYDKDAKQQNRGQDRKLYSPPTGKWSDSAGSYQAPRGGQGRGGFRGGFRNRGRGRGFRGYRY